MLLHRGIKSKSEKTWGRDGQKSLPFYIHSTSLKEVLYAMIIKVTTRNV